jgi:hypothetical protein
MKKRVDRGLPSASPGEDKFHDRPLALHSPHHALLPPHYSGSVRAMSSGSLPLRPTRVGDVLAEPSCDAPYVAQCAHSG